MAAYSFHARDDAGNLLKGDIDAADLHEAARKLRSEGKFVIRVEPRAHAVAPAARRPAFGGGDRFRPDDLIYFTNQLAVMVETGVSLAEALDACVHEGNSPRFARALDRVIDSVRGGKEFSAALAEHPRVFPALYVSLVRASEASGQLAPILARLAEHLERQRELTKKIKGALTYPAVMVTFAIGTTAFLVSYVLPKFAQIYAGREEELPALTRALLKFADFIAAYWPYGLGIFVAGGVALFLYARSPAGRWSIELFRLRIPLVGKLFHCAYLARSMRTLGTMIQAGVSMLESVQLTRGVVGSLYYQRLWDTVNERIERGQQVSESLADCPHVPKSIIKMLGAGEKSGRLGVVMNRIANFSEQELNTAIRNMTAMVEPGIIMFLGVVVGSLVLAMLLPIFKISKVM